MRTSDCENVLSRFSTGDKIRFLARLGWELTIAGRDAYTPKTEELTHPARLRAINEIQHRVLSHILALASKDPQRYPDDELVTMILDETQDPVLNAQVQSAFDRAAEFVQAKPH